MRCYFWLMFAPCVSVFVGFSSVAPAAATQAVQPSFNCALAKGVVERTICDNPALAEEDALMARLYEATRTSALGRGPSNELAAQREWLKNRSSCGALDHSAHPSPVQCLSGSYQNRNQALAVATLFAEPALARETLRRIDPDAAPLYEALVGYLNAPEDTNWATAPRRPAMIRLLQPYFDHFATDGDLSYGHDILTSAKILTPADALRSEENFVQFLQIASAYLRSEPIPRPFPCAAIIRRPGLLDATGAMFGSTLDNFIFYPDCIDTLPPMPKLEALRSRINDSWPDCDGTIRYSAYRAFGQTVNGARVANAADIRRFAKSAEARKAGRMRRLKGVPPELVTAAVTELGTYYQTYQKADAPSARLFATKEVHDILTAGHSCGDMGEE